MTERIFVGKIPVNLFTPDTLHNTIGNTIRKKQKRLFLHANARLIELANTTEKWLIDFYNNPDHYVMCDGAGIQIAAKLTRQPIPLKIPYNTWIWDLIKFLSVQGFSIYILGADQKTIQKSFHNLKMHEPELKIVGYHHGYFPKDANSKESSNVIDHINRCQPDVLLIGFGMPIQEKWVKENLTRLNTYAVFTCGGAFDFVSGKNRVAPYIFRKLYLEWLFRFMLEPIRLLGRATVSNFRFLKIIFRNVKNG